jgi:hypothetical protein
LGGKRHIGIHVRTFLTSFSRTAPRAGALPPAISHFRNFEH